ncbi:hypothetical protein [Burkholderia vietnamiensis]|uniref:hypothetical protein n=1 Tax=Burkholderia vietnamiensis TaxID=60552 RepID=UPI00158E6FC3|nr:hypothetical protein [Burkholderia vietnamiensis]
MNHASLGQLLLGPIQSRHFACDKKAYAAQHANDIAGLNKSMCSCSMRFKRMFDTRSEFAERARIRPRRSWMLRHGIEAREKNKTAG